MQEFYVIFDGSNVQIDIYCSMCDHWFGKLIGATIKSLKTIIAICPRCKEERPIFFRTS